ncbi:MAG: response regulator [Vicinamibacterales bacterium]
MKRDRVFIVEDEGVVAFDVSGVLASAGLDVVGMAHSAEDALRAITPGSVDLVVSDIRLGQGIDGVTLARQLWARQQLRTVLLTAFADPQTMAQSIAAGVAGYVVKPFDDRQLLSSVLLALRWPEPDASGVPRVWNFTDEQRQTITLLSPREREVLDALLSNRRVSHIAEDLSISPFTVRNHLKAIFRKFAVSSQAELLAKLQERGPESRN